MARQEDFPAVFQSSIFSPSYNEPSRHQSDSQYGGERHHGKNLNRKRIDYSRPPTSECPRNAASSSRNNYPYNASERSGERSYSGASYEREGRNPTQSWNSERPLQFEDRNQSLNGSGQDHPADGSGPGSASRRAQQTQGRHGKGDWQNSEPSLRQEDGASTNKRTGFNEENDIAQPDLKRARHAASPTPSINLKEEEVDELISVLSQHEVLPSSNPDEPQADAIKAQPLLFGMEFSSSEAESDTDVQSETPVLAESRSNQIPRSAVASSARTTLEEGRGRRADPAQTSSQGRKARSRAPPVPVEQASSEQEEQPTSTIHSRTSSRLGRSRRVKTPPVDPFDRLVTQHEDLCVTGDLAATNGTIIQSATRRLQRRDKDSDTSEMSGSSSDEDRETSGMGSGPSLAQVVIQIERQRHRLVIANEKARRASRKMARLCRRLEHLATASSLESVPSSPARERSPVPTQTQTATPARSIQPSRPPSPEPSPEWEPASLPSIDSLYDLSQKTLGEFPRKPRSLLLPPDHPESVHNSVIVSTLDGNLNLYHRKGKKHTQTILHDELRNYWSEDIAWVSPTVLAIAAADKANQTMTKNATVINHQLALLYDCSSKKNKISYKIAHLTENLPHDRGITKVYPFEHPGNKTRWLTGGADKKIILWSFDGPFSEAGKIKTIPIHTQHTAAITGMAFLQENEILYSCGLDSRLVGWSMEQSRNVLPIGRMDGKARDVEVIPTNPSLLLLGFAEPTNQLRLYDTRLQRTVLTFGLNESNESSRSDTSRYRHPSVDRNGYRVSLGHIRDGSIAIWDMRHIGAANGPAQFIRGHGKRVIVAKFDHFKDTESLISISHDNSIMYTTFKTRADQIPQQIS
ncbi:hypothetical protein DFS34DRAFT_644817 [Phlyctochytrium arcticum]|nr:hypothetical protein DFS34DRAFT_644817 [Phlyctochytrium arcticum]